jgi:predicted lipoprotein with Yx(FWY)xxD motif
MIQRLLSLIVVGLAVSLAASCSNSSTKTSPPTTLSSSGTSATSLPATTSTSGSSVSVGTETNQYGTVLTSGGRTLYLLTSDPANQSTCSGACVASWPLVSGTATAGSGVSASMLGTITRSDGTQQVTYASHPLYFYAGDSAAGQTNGQGINSFGGIWAVVSASSGQMVMHPVGSGSGATSTTSGSGAGATAPTTKAGWA